MVLGLRSKSPAVFPCLAFVGALLVAEIEHVDDAANSTARLEVLANPRPAHDASVIDPGAGILWIQTAQSASFVGIGRRGTSVLIDAGDAESANAVSLWLDRVTGGHVDLWVQRDWLANHAGGLMRIAAGLDGTWGTQDDLDIVQAWDAGAGANSTAAILYPIVTASIRQIVDVDDRYLRDDLELRVVSRTSSLRAPGSGMLSLCLDLAGMRVLIAGDEPWPIASRAAARCGPVDILWLGDHGSWTAFSPEILEHAQPRVVVVSPGYAPERCLPDGRVLEHLRDLPTWILGGLPLTSHERCPALGPELSPLHRVIAGDLWIAAPRAGCYAALQCAKLAH